jgi:ABC-type antimicrobial peptide transport system permease subunit
MGTGLLMLLVSLGAIVGGFMLIVEPAGTPLKLSVDMLKETPFTDYLIPGIILMAVIGILGLLSAYIAFKKQGYAGFGAIVMGIGHLDCC